MEPGVVLAIAIACVALAVAAVWAVRRAADADTRVTWIVAVAMVLGGLTVAWAGVTVAAFDMPVGLVILAIGAVAVVLLSRAMRETIRQSIADERSGNAPGPWRDHLVWGVIGAPVLLAALLVIAAMAIRLARP
jgi:hypothetical protein